MIYVDRKLKYMFEEVPANYVDDEDMKKSFRVDMLVYETFKKDELKHISDGEWSVIHKDGNLYNDHLDNLELVVFKDDKFFKDNKKLEEKMLLAKRKAEEKEIIAKKADFENTVNKNKIISLTKQVEYEQKRVKELNKELKKKESEIRRLMDIMNKRC